MEEGAPEAVRPSEHLAHLGDLPRELARWREHEHARLAAACQPVARLGLSGHRLDEWQREGQRLARARPRACKHIGATLE
eukprot:scaffold32674_cov29-Tisochrysis_lutea.AAC.2